MSFTSVSNAPEAAPKAAVKSDWTEFKGHNVYKGTVQQTWGEWFSRTDIASLQDEYSKAHPNSKEVPTWKVPIVLIGNALSNFVEMIRNAFRTVFFCFSEKPKDGEAASQKKAGTK